MAFYPARKIKAGDETARQRRRIPRQEREDPAHVWVGRPNERKSQSFPTISSDVCAPVMEMQIKLSERVMTDEITDAARRNRLLHVEDSNHLRNTQ